MALYTGILGTKDSQPGKFWLGSGPVSSSNINSQSIADTVTTSTTIATSSLLLRALTDSVTVSSTVIKHGVINKAVVDTVTVSASLVAPRTAVESLSDIVTVTESISEMTVVFQAVADTVTVSDAIALVGNPHARVTQAVTEFFYTETAAARLTQAVVEYFFNSGRTVTANVVDDVVVSSTPRNKSVAMYVTDLADVTQVCFGRNTNVRISVVTSISITVPEIEKNNLTVTDTVAVAQNVSVKLPVVHITVIDTVMTPEFFPNPVTFGVSHNRILMADFITVNEDISGNTEIPSFVFADAIGVQDSIGVSPVLVTVDDTIVVGDAIGQGLSLRNINVTDTALVSSIPFARNNHIRLSVESDVAVSHTRAFTIRQSKIAISVIDTVSTNLSIHNGTLELGPFDVVKVTDTIVAFAPYVHQFPIDTVAVSEKIHLTPLRLTVTDMVAVKSTLSHFELVVVDRVTVSDSFHRVHDVDVTDTLTFTETVTTKQTHGQHVIDALPIIEVMTRQATWYRTFEDTLTFSDPSFQRSLDFAGTVINVPIAVGTLVSITTTLQSVNGIIILPAPLLGDSLDNVAKTTIQRSMNAQTLVFKQSSTRQRLKNTFRLDAVKAFELRTFLETNLSVLLTLTTWSGQIWSVYLTGNPFELQNAGRSGNSGNPIGPNEYSTIELEFEGVKLSG